MSLHEKERKKSLACQPVNLLFESIHAFCATSRVNCTCELIESW